MILFLCVYLSRAFWQLDWSDEFNQDTLDSKKWEIDESDKDRCDSKL